MQRAIGRGHAVRVAEHPVAADAIARFQAVKRDSGLMQRLAAAMPL